MNTRDVAVKELAHVISTEYILKKYHDEYDLLRKTVELVLDIPKKETE